MDRAEGTHAEMQPGQVLAPGIRLGEYEIERILGSGGMGTVYAAWHPILRSRAAIKVLNPDVSHDAAMVGRFVSEAQAASRISHPNIIKIFGFGELPDGRKYFVMEYLEGETMAAWLAKGPPAPDEALALLLQVCEALEAAHREGIVHRDLKPDNLWIARPKHGHPYIKVLDFGIAKALEGPPGKGITQTGSVLGTPQFMSPEQCIGRGVDHRTDLYAMGGILYCVYCGRPPFERESAAELVAAHLHEAVPLPSTFARLPPALERLILACLDKTPAGRPQSAAELGTLLRAAAAPAAMAALDRPAQPATERLPAATAREIELPRDTGSGAVFAVTPEPLAAAPAQPRRRRRRRWLLLALGVGALLAFGVWLAARTREPPPSERPPVVPESEVEPTATPSPPPPVATPPTTTSTETAPRRPPGKRTGRPRATPTATPELTPPGRSPSTAPVPSRTRREGLIEENPFQ